MLAKAVLWIHSFLSFHLSFSFFLEHLDIKRSAEHEDLRKRKLHLPYENGCEQAWMWKEMNTMRWVRERAQVCVCMCVCVRELVHACVSERERLWCECFIHKQSRGCKRNSVLNQQEKGQKGFRKKTFFCSVNFFVKSFSNESYNTYATSAHKTMLLIFTQLIWFQSNIIIQVHISRMCFAGNRIWTHDLLFSINISFKNWEGQSTVECGSCDNSDHR